MLVKFKKVDILSTPKVGFYTIALEEDPETEFEKFDARDFTHHQEERNIIYKSLQQMGLREAKPWYFREEQGAHALPCKNDVPNELKENNNDFGIRLYCIRLTDNLVILLNGDIKTTLKAQDCPNVAKHFKLATKLAKEIDRARVELELMWTESGTTIKPDEIELRI